MRLKESRDPNKVYMYERRMLPAHTGQKLEVKDLSSSQISIVDDMKSLYEIVLALIGSSHALVEWEFIVNWGSLTFEEKLIKYDRYNSNEMNLFLCFKDKEFFEGVAKPHIINKGNKKLIDLFLLEDKSELRKFLASFKLNELTILEKLLLVIALHVDEKKKCQRIVQHSKLQLQ